MEARKIVVDLEQVDLLEKKIIKAVEVVRALRRERDVARLKLQETQAALDRLQGEHQAATEGQLESRELTRQIEILQEERVAVRGKVTRMLEMMASLDEVPGQARSDH
jgi:hypothetical protein